MRLVAVLFALAACGGHPPVPARGVVEGDLGAWKYKRFQGPLLDPEVYVEKNHGETNTASYITSDAEKRGHIEDKDLVNVSVTRYERPDGVVRATVKFVRRLAQEQGYTVDEAKIGGERVINVVGHSEAWVMWPSTRYVVKVGARNRADVPKKMIEQYASRYPSQLPGGALEGPLPPGPEDEPGPQKKPDYDPKNPQPDMDRYDPKQVVIPANKPDQK
jgi:hypothetical protein